MAAVTTGLARGFGRALMQRSENEREDRVRGEENAREDLARAKEQAIQTAREERGIAERKADREQRAGERKEDNERHDKERAEDLADRAEVRGFAQKDKEAERADRASDIASTAVGDDGSLYGVTRKGEAVDTGISGARGLGGRTAANGGAMPEGDKRLIDSLKARFTTKKGLDDVTDWDAVDAELRRRGRGDLAVGEEGGPARIDETSDAWLNAMSQAKTIASERADTWKSDKNDPTFKDTQGSRSEWIRNKARELFQQNTGRAAPAGGDSDAGLHGEQPMGGDTPGGPPAKYASKEDVRNALMRGDIDRAEAERILMEQFGGTKKK